MKHGRETNMARLVETRAEEEGLYPGGTQVPTTGLYFNAGPGGGVHSGLERFKVGEKFPSIKQGWFWKFFGSEEELGPLPKRMHEAGPKRAACAARARRSGFRHKRETPPRKSRHCDSKE